MLRDQKEDFIKGMKDELGRAQAVLFLDYTGLTVAEADALRKSLRKSSVGYRVVKNTLMKRALEGTEYSKASEYLKGTPTGVVFGYDDPVSAARTTFEFLKTCEHLKVKGAVVENRAVSKEEAEQISKMPNRREMQAQILAMILGPAGQLISQIKSAAGRIVGALDAKAKEEGKQA